MPKLCFYLSGLLIGTIQADVIPSPGSEVTFVTDSCKKGLVPGSVIRFTVEGENCQPTHYDYSGNNVVAHIDVNDYEVIKSGPELED